MNRANHPQPAMLLRKALLRADKTCENMHHDKHERHDGLDCPVEKWVNAALNEAETLAANEQQPPTYADGYCAYCSELSRPLTRALESTGVPTGEKDWQQTYGPNKVRALADYHTCLQRLLSALETGKPEDVQRERQRAEGYLATHGAIYRRLNTEAQKRSLYD